MAADAQGAALGIIAVLGIGCIICLVFAWTMDIVRALFKKPRKLLAVPIGAGVIGLLGTAFTGALLGSILVGAGIGLAVSLFLAYLEADSY